jgi:hypothetical protein
MALSIAICIAAFLCLLWILRRDRISLGLPIAYLFSLLFIHVPGAYAHLASDVFRHNSEFSEIGIRYTAIGAVSFVAGVWVVGLFSSWRQPIMHDIDHQKFILFCLFGGWFVTYGLSFLHQIPSLGAAVDKGGAIWMLGVMLGLRSAIEQGNLKLIGIWLATLAVYPILMLLLGGFLSYGSTAVIIVLSVLGISIVSPWKLSVGLIIGVYLGLSLFVNYFGHRTGIRKEVWGGAPLVDRIDASLDMFGNFKWFDPNNERHFVALDERLNQNYFVGLAATRIERGRVDYLYGQSVWEGLISLVPRAVWAEKPVFAGSPKIVSKMTGLQFSKNTSFGIGNVMEFQINFGIPGLVIGFFLLGFLIRILDRNAAAAERRGDLGKTILCFLPVVALIQPNGSIVELCSGAAAALVAAYGWKWAWERFGSTQRATAAPMLETSPKGYRL